MCLRTSAQVKSYPTGVRCRSVAALPSIAYLVAALELASSGDAKPMSQPNPSLPQKPELVTLSPEEHLLHNAALCRGQGEGMAQSSVALMSASAHYKKQDFPDAQKVVVCQILEQLSAQLSAQAAKSQQDQHVRLGQWMVARNASAGQPDSPPDAVIPHRVGWAVRAWRATVGRAWTWTFAK